MPVTDSPGKPGSVSNNSVPIVNHDKIIAGAAHFFESYLHKYQEPSWDGSIISNFPLKFKYR